MSEKVEYDKLNADDRRLIAMVNKRSKNLVDKVLRGERNNLKILETADKILVKKAAFEQELISESITEALETTYN